MSASSEATRGDSPEPEGGWEAYYQRWLAFTLEESERRTNPKLRKP